MPLSTRRRGSTQQPQQQTNNVTQRYGNDGQGFNQDDHTRNMERFRTDSQAFDSELSRVNDVIANRRASGKDTTNQMNYYDQLMALDREERDFSPLEPPQTQQTVRERAETPINVDDFRTERTTMEDLAKQYGFDYSREAAQRQAEAERQAAEDGIAHQRREADMNVESAGEALDRDYFQQMQRQMQGQTNSGLNAGIAADQDLRMAMNRQAEMGDIYRDRNLTRADLDAQLGRLEQEALAREDSLHHERLSQGFDQAMQRDELSMREQQTMLDAALQNRGLDMDLDQSDRDFALREGELTGSYLSNTQRDQINELFDLKEANESGISHTSEEFRQNAARADEIRRDLALSGVDTSLLAGDVSREEAQQNLNQVAQTTIGGRQQDELERSNRENEKLAREKFETPYSELTKWQKFQVDIETARLDETIRSNKSREDLAWEQFNRPYHELTMMQQEDLELRWAQQELAYEMFDRPYDQLTQAERQRLNQNYAQMSFNAGVGGAYADGGAGGASGNPQAQADRNSGNVRLDY